MLIERNKHLNKIINGSTSCICRFIELLSEKGGNVVFMWNLEIMRVGLSRVEEGTLKCHFTIIEKKKGQNRGM